MDGDPLNKKSQSKHMTQNGSRVFSTSGSKYIADIRN